MVEIGDQLLISKRNKIPINKIYDLLLLNTTYLDDYGLYEGKTGCLLFFAHYAKQYEDKVNNEIVSELIDDVFANAARISAYNMKYGICGIGWAVEYLLQNRLLEGNSDEVLFDLDKKIVKNEINDRMPHADIAGIAKYIAVRLTSPCGNFRSETPYSTTYLNNFYSTVAGMDLKTDTRKDLVVIKKVLQAGRYPEKRAVLSPDMVGDVSMDKFPFISLSLHNGLSGLGIKLLLNE